MKTCFGCLNLRQGSYLSGAFSILISLVGIAMCAYGIIVAPKILKSTVDKMVEEGKIKENQEQQVIDVAEGYANIILIIRIIIYGLWLLAGLILTAGTYKRVNGALTFWLVCAGILVGLMALGTLNCVWKAEKTFSNAQSVGQFLVGVLCLVFTIYAMVGVSAYRKELVAEGWTPYQRQMDDPPAYAVYVETYSQKA